MVMTPDFSTLRLLPWLPGTALVMADLSWDDGSPVTAGAAQHPARADRPARRARDWCAYVGTELEFMVFDDTYREAWAAGYRGLTPATDYNVDYAMLASTRMEPLLRDIRLGMDGRGHVLRGRQGRVQPRASRRSRSATTTRWSPATTTRSTRTAPRRSPTSTARA